MTQIECKRCGRLIRWDPAVAPPPELCQSCVEVGTWSNSSSERLSRYKKKVEKLRAEIQKSVADGCTRDEFLQMYRKHNLSTLVDALFGIVQGGKS